MSAQDFRALVEMAMKVPGLAAMRPVVEKEILHYDIFHALDRGGLLNDLVFQGGTSLRLCRGSDRFSEDLDFAGGRNFSTAGMHEIKQCVEDHIGRRYGLNVTVKEPRHDDVSTIEHIKLHRWEVSVETSPENRAMPRQRIKLEIANIPAYTKELVPLQINYDFLAGMSNVLVYTESMSEIMADKVLAFPTSVTDANGGMNALSSKRLRHRDIWDLAWLAKRKATLDPALVLKKVIDYQVQGYSDLLGNAIKALPTIVNSNEFKDQMRRFVDLETITRTVEQSAYLEYLAVEVGGILETMQSALVATQSTPTRPSETQ